ncbi:hypothetical protein NHQ30_000091 [Ciborinia camelliae]|nr:hypothetical protein NHQ30_000091 [Ciborinia camelliae]
MAGSCPALDTPQTLWSFCPNIGAAYLFAIIFGLTTVTHFVQAIIHRKAYCWVVVVSGTAQTLAYIFRVLSIKYPASFTNYAAWFILILIAPLFTNAFAYMVMGRMVWNYIAEAKIWKITAWRLGLYFVVLDVVALLIQIYGAAAASANNVSQHEVLQGLHVYMVGVGIQQFFILVFLFFAFKFHQTLRDQSRRNIHTPQQAWSLLYALYAVILLITTRIIFRLAEYSQGLTSSIPNHEAFQYVLDSVPMFFALILLNIFHPGRIMAGPESNIPGRKERKSTLFQTKMQSLESRGSGGVQMILYNFRKYEGQRIGVSAKIIEPRQYNADFEIERVAPGQRKRAYKPKTKTGCLTCNESKTSIVLVRSPSSSVLFTSDRERRAFHFFINMTAPMMGGFGEENCWSEMIPRAAHHEPSILHALIALGALHESREKSSRSAAPNNLLAPAEEEFSLVEYNRAIRCLVEPFSKNERQAMDVCLINCVLFSAFEMMQGNYGSGAAHQESGSKILCEITYDENSKKHYHESLKTSAAPYLPMELLEELYLRSDFVLSQARNTLHFFWSRFRNELNHLNRYTDSPEFAKRFHIWRMETIGTTHKWLSAFQAFILKYGDTFSEAEKVGVAILQIQSHTGYMNAHIPRGMIDNQMLWDPFLSIFEKITVLAEAVITNPAFTTTVFQIDMGVIGPLYHVAGACRHPIVRRRAIALLEHVPSLQEGIWNAGMTARVARMVMELEEFGIAEVREAADVPDWARISDVAPAFEKEGRRVTLRYTRNDRAQGPLVRNAFTETFEW